MQRLKQDGDLYKIPIEVDSGYKSCGAGTYNDYDHETGFVSTTDLVALLTTVNVALHNTVMGLVPQAIAEPDTLRQHYPERHTSTHDKSPWCKQAKLRARRAFRKMRDHRAKLML